MHGENDISKGLQHCILKINQSLVVILGNWNAQYRSPVFQQASIKIITTSFPYMHC